MTRAARSGAHPKDTRSERTPLFVVGASGMMSGELLRLAAEHPALELAAAISREPGRALTELHPHLDAGTTVDLAAATQSLRAALKRGPAALVLGLPHGAAAEAWRALRSELGELAERALVVDLSADYRLKDAAAYGRWYGRPHADQEELARFAYGLPELGREALEGATRVAAPGCFATALQLSTWPAARAGWIDAGTPWRFSAVTGSSGSGVAPTAGTHHPYRHGNLWAYGLGGHRHEAELEQTLDRLGLEPEICFVPHSGPFARGIHLTAMLPLAAEIDLGEARAGYRAAYEDEPFVRVSDAPPNLRRVVGSNACEIGVFARGRTLIVLATLDNLIKGGSGQALQCLNRMLGFPETLGLPRRGLGVV